MMKFKFNLIVAVLVSSLTGCSSSDSKDESTVVDDYTISANLENVTQLVVPVLNDELSVVSTQSVSTQSVSVLSDGGNADKSVVKGITSDGELVSPLELFDMETVIEGKNEIVFTIADREVEVEVDSSSDATQTALYYKQLKGCEIFKVVKGSNEVSCLTQKLYANRRDGEALMGAYLNGYYYFTASLTNYSNQPDPDSGLYTKSSISLDSAIYRVSANGEFTKLSPNSSLGFKQLSFKKGYLLGHAGADGIFVVSKYDTSEPHVDKVEVQHELTEIHVDVTDDGNVITVRDGVTVYGVDSGSIRSWTDYTTGATDEITHDTYGLMDGLNGSFYLFPLGTLNPSLGMEIENVPYVIPKSLKVINGVATFVSESGGEYGVYKANLHDKSYTKVCSLNAISYQASEVSELDVNHQFQTDTVDGVACKVSLSDSFDTVDGQYVIPVELINSTVFDGASGQEILVKAYKTGVIRIFNSNGNIVSLTFESGLDMQSVKDAITVVSEGNHVSSVQQGDTLSMLVDLGSDLGRLNSTDVVINIDKSLIKYEDGSAYEFDDEVIVSL